MMICISLIYSRATCHLHCFNVYILDPYAFYFSYCEVIDWFLKKAALGSVALVRGWRDAYLRADAYERKCSKAENAQYS